jgi:hypothetical protein
VLVHAHRHPRRCDCVSADSTSSAKWLIRRRASPLRFPRLAGSDPDSRMMGSSVACPRNHLDLLNQNICRTAGRDRRPAGREAKDRRQFAANPDALAIPLRMKRDAVDKRA